MAAPAHDELPNWLWIGVYVGADLYNPLPTGILLSLRSGNPRKDLIGELDGFLNSHESGRTMTRSVCASVPSTNI
jgi:hypothetical protein